MPCRAGYVSGRSAIRATFCPAEADKPSMNRETREDNRISNVESSSKFASQYGTGSECVPYREMRMGSKFLKCCVSSEMALELWPSKSRAVTIILIAGAIVAVPIIYPPILQKFVDH